MLLKAKITEIFTQIKQRYFKVNLMSNQTSNLVQFHSGGEDYCPLINVEGLASSIGDNPAKGVIFAWRDDVTRKSLPGEKRFYSVKIDEETGETLEVTEIYLKNDGSVDITGTTTVNINATTDVNINATGNANITAATVNLGGDGGAFVLTEKTEIKDGEGRVCTITSNTSKTKAM